MVKSLYFFVWISSSWFVITVTSSFCSQVFSDSGVEERRPTKQGKVLLRPLHCIVYTFRPTAMLFAGPPVWKYTPQPHWHRLGHGPWLAKRIWTEWFFPHPKEAARFIAWIHCLVILCYKIKISSCLSPRVRKDQSFNGMRICTIIFVIIHRNFCGICYYSII